MFKGYSSVLISKDFKLRSVLKDTKGINIRTFSSISCINLNDKSIKYLLFDISLIDEKKILGYAKEIKDLRENIVIFFLVESIDSFDSLLFLKNGIDYVVDKDSISSFLRSIILKDTLELRDIDHTFKYHQLTLDIKHNFLRYQECMIFLSTEDSYLLYILIRSKDYVSLEDIKKHMDINMDKDISRDCLRIRISRIRKRIKDITGLNIIENRYGHGYRISI